MAKLSVEELEERVDNLESIIDELRTELYRLKKLIEQEYSEEISSAKRRIDKIENKG